MGRDVPVSARGWSPRAFWGSRTPGQVSEPRGVAVTCAHQPEARHPRGKGLSRAISETSGLPFHAMERGAVVLRAGVGSDCRGEASGCAVGHEFGGNLGHEINRTKLVANWMGPEGQQTGHSSAARWGRPCLEGPQVREVHMTRARRMVGPRGAGEP